MSPAPPVPLIVLYRWRLRPDAESRFAAAWSAATRELLARGSLGSRLHHGDDGFWYGYAQWPDEATRAAAFAAAEPSLADPLRGCIAEALPTVTLTPVADFLRPLPPTAVHSG